MAKKIIIKLINLAFILLWVWFIASFIDIVSNNLASEPVYQSWNAFQWFLRIAGK